MPRRKQKLSKPKKALRIKNRKINVYFEDECPRIGSGWRIVNVNMGYKWCRFTDAATGNKARLPVKVAEKIIGSSRFLNRYKPQKAVHVAVTR